MKNGARRTPHDVGHRKSTPAKRRRLHHELLERRDLLAAGMNNVLIDFTPDTINNEYQVDSFASLFDGSPLSQSNQFLNYDASDTTIDSDDAKIAASRIASKVRQHLLTFEKDPTINLRVLYTPDILSPTDPGTGERWLQNGQQAAQENTYVIYVGAGRPSENLPKYGLSHQAYSGRNNEFYGFYCLILEDPKTVAQLGKLRKNKPNQAESGGGLVDMVADQSNADQNADIADRITGEIRRHDSPDVVEEK